MLIIQERPFYDLVHFDLEQIIEQTFSIFQYSFFMKLNTRRLMFLAFLKIYSETFLKFQELEMYTELQSGQNSKPTESDWDSEYIYKGY